jgi:GntR family transcriptional repressor for pyruvate dehydrogenase complex
MEHALSMMATEIEAGSPGLDGDRRFHLGVAAASHNPILIQLLTGIRESLDRTSETRSPEPVSPKNRSATTPRSH